MTNKITKDSILTALSKVQEPDLNKDLVTLNMIHNLEIQDETVSFTIMLTTPACPFRAKLERESKEAVMAVEGVKNVIVKMDSDVPNDGRMRGLVKMPIRNAIAAAAPIRHQRKPSSYMNSTRLVVLRSGPPLVITYGSAKSWK